TTLATRICRLDGIGRVPQRWVRNIRKSGVDASTSAVGASAPSTTYGVLGRFLSCFLCSSCFCFCTCCFWLFCLSFLPPLSPIAWLLARHYGSWRRKRFTTGLLFWRD